jgi:hypothetical protein
MKSGTTWWWAILTSHPDIASPRARPNEAAVPDSLAEENERIYGAKEIHFFEHYGRAEDVDPASYHRYFPRLKGGADLTAPVIDHQFRRAFYWQQTQNLLNYFEPDRILVLQYERCARETAREAERTFAFLGVDSDRWQPSPEYARHVGPVYSRPTVNEATRAALLEAIRPDISRLLAEFPEIDGDLWPSMNHERR